MAHIVRFDCFEADLDSGQLFKSGAKVRLRDQSFQVLAALAERPGEVVTRDELRGRLWSRDVFVDFDDNLNAVIARLREALGDSATRPRFIETLPKRGYRFLAPVSELAHAPRPSAPRVRLVVLPFLNLSGDPAQESFGDAVTDEMITELASLAPAELAVIARTTAMRYKSSRKDVARIGQELSADYVVEGGARRTADKIGITVQLIQARDQSHLFSRKYEADVRDLSTLERRMAQAVASAIPGLPENVAAGAMTGLEPRSKGTRDPAAYEEYIQGRFHAEYSEYVQGRHLMNRGSAEALAKAQRHLERAIARDAEFAQAYDALAELYWYRGYLGFMSPRQAFSAGIVHALRAIEIDNARAETHALLGQFHKIGEYNWQEVEREMALALRLDPNSPLVRMRYAVSGLMPQGRIEEAAAQLERALESDPLSYLARFWLAIMMVLLRRYDRAIEEARNLRGLDPDCFQADFVLGVCHAYRGDLVEAVAALRQGAVVSGNSAMMLGWLGLVLAMGGRASEAREVLGRLRAMAATAYVPASSFAWIHLGLKEVDTAFAWLDRAVDDCDQFMMPIKTYRFLDPVRGDPRFRALLRKMNLKP